LSIVENPRGKGVSQYVYKMEKAGMPTRYNVARQAIDESVALSLTIEEFKSELRKRGYNYRFDPQRKYWTVTPPGWKKAIRIHQLGENYTREAIERRIYENDPSVRQQRLRQNYKCRITTTSAGASTASWDGAALRSFISVTATNWVIFRSTDRIRQSFIYC
ncbi:MAG: hypothetical protein IKK28_10515, partial [Mogibacterium sp.]|nr:hypothetical protein [Mogibacterium sp.]